jgi:small subunit ribosomal protein S27Ae
MAEEKKGEKKKERKARPYQKGKQCPKCGPGYKLAEHKERRSCGKCGYFEKK